MWMWATHWYTIWWNGSGYTYFALYSWFYADFLEPSVWTLARNIIKHFAFPSKINHFDVFSSMILPKPILVMDCVAYIAIVNFLVICCFGLIESIRCNPCFWIVMIALTGWESTFVSCAQNQLIFLRQQSCNACWYSFQKPIHFKTDAQKAKEKGLIVIFSMCLLFCQCSIYCYHPDC